jgi:hypothetical protein
MKAKRDWGIASLEGAIASLKRSGRLATERKPKMRRMGTIYPLLLLGVLFPLAAEVRAVIPIPGGGGATNTLLSTWSFTDTTNWLSDRGYPPLSFTNLSASDLGAGTALVVDSTNAAWLRYKVVESDGSTNLAIGRGSVMFWFAPNWAGTNEGGTGPEVSGRLIEVGSYTTNASYGWWSLYVDPAGANLYFAAQSNNGSQATYLSAPIGWTTNRWHLIALTYSSTNSALYLDGALATNGIPVTCLPGSNALANGFCIGSTSNGTAQAHGMFDGLATYANPLDAGSIAATYWYTFVTYDLNPFNSANWSSAPSSPQVTPTFAAITGTGYLQNLGAVSNCASSSAVWMTNVVATLVTNGTMNLAFTIMGGSNSAPYDVFATPALACPITNALWAWMGQGYQCMRYLLTNLPPYSALMILGTTNDTDQDGLTDAYELLVSHTNPRKADTSGDGMLDGWKVLWGLNPSVNNPSQSGERCNFTYYLEGWLSGVSGVRAETVGADAEGNLTGN